MIATRRREAARWVAREADTRAVPCGSVGPSATPKKGPGRSWVWAPAVAQLGLDGGSGAEATPLDPSHGQLRPAPAAQSTRAGALLVRRRARLGRRLLHSLLVRHSEFHFARPCVPGGPTQACAARPRAPDRVPAGWSCRLAVDPAHEHRAPLLGARGRGRADGLRRRRTSDGSAPSHSCGVIRRVVAVSSISLI